VSGHTLRTKDTVLCRVDQFPASGSEERDRRQRARLRGGVFLISRRSPRCVYRCVWRAPPASAATTGQHHGTTRTADLSARRARSPGRGLVRTSVRALRRGPRGAPGVRRTVLCRAAPMNREKYRQTFTRVSLERLCCDVARGALPVAHWHAAARAPRVWEQRTLAGVACGHVVCLPGGDRGRSSLRTESMRASGGRPPTSALAVNKG
jgi:hypothetical protein